MNRMLCNRSKSFFFVFAVCCLVFSFSAPVSCADELLLFYIYNTSADTGLSENILKKISEMRKKQPGTYFIHCGNFISKTRTNAVRKEKQQAVSSLLSGFKSYDLNTFTLGEKEISSGIEYLIPALESFPEILIINSNVQYCSGNSCLLFARPYFELPYGRDNLLKLYAFADGNSANKEVKVERNLKKLSSIEADSPGIYVITGFTEKERKAVVKDISGAVIISCGNNPGLKTAGGNHLLLLKKRGPSGGLLTISIEEGRITAVTNAFIN